jgi:hypothetical protein
MRVTCATSIGASCGWSLLTDRAAHSELHSRSQPQEQMTSQRTSVYSIPYAKRSVRDNSSVVDGNTA